MKKVKFAIPYYNQSTPYVMWACEVSLDEIPEEHRRDARLLLMYFASHCEERSVDTQPYNMATVCNRKMERMMKMGAEQLLGLMSYLASAGVVKDHSYEWHESDLELLTHFQDPDHVEYRKGWSKFEGSDLKHKTFTEDLDE